MRRLICACFFVAGTCASPAHAQNAGNQAAAEALFDEGKVAMAAHRYAEACPKFVASNRLDEGIGTSLWLADCYEKNGQTASAWAQFREAAALAVKTGDPREKVARGRAQALEGRLARLVLIVPPAARLPGLRVARDGAEVTSAMWATSVPTDPGPHTVVVSAPDHRPQTLTVSVQPGPGEQALLVPVLDEAPASPGASSPAGIARQPLGPSDDAVTKLPSQRIAAVAVGALGLVGVGVASYFGAHAKSELDESNANDLCTANNRCDAAGVSDRASAQSSATASTILFVAGGAVLVGGAVLWFTAPSSGGPTTTARATARFPKVWPWLEARAGGVVLRSDF